MRILTTAVLVALVSGPTAASAQGSTARQGYFAAISEHFRVSPEEVRILSEWRLAADEIPVVLFIASRAGVSPDAVARLRGDGQAWDAVARTFDLGSSDFHVALGRGDVPVMLARAYREFSSRPRGEWDQIRLLDQEVIALVNVHFLSALLRVTPRRVLRAAEESGTFVGAHRVLGGP